MFKKTARIFIVWVCLTMLFGCSTTEFARYRGRALKFGIPLYQGVPPQEYTYKSLGLIKGEYKKRFFDDTGFAISNALENLAKKAKDTGANAVIKVKFNPAGSISRYDGEAVVFDKLPNEK